VSMLNLRKSLIAKKKEIEQTILDLGRDHYYSFISSL
jgi:hypothetical protein